MPAAAATNGSIHMSDAPDWLRDAIDWPNRSASRFVESAGLRWHVQRLGVGTPVLLVHGTASSTHSWADLLPLLAQSHEVLALDLPGHGFTQGLPRDRMSLPSVAAAVSELLRTLSVSPVCVVGHSAGAAILARMCLDGHIAPAQLVSVNGALLPLSGMYNPALAPLTRWLTSGYLLPRLLASQADRPGSIERLLHGSGSRLSQTQIDRYRRLIRHPRHIAAALDMMAMWDLRPLERDLPSLRTALLLITGGNDRMIPPAEAGRAARLVFGSRICNIPGLGHLAHEERPDLVGQMILQFMQDGSVTPA